MFPLVWWPWELGNPGVSRVYLSIRQGASPRPTMRKRVCLPFLLCLQALPSISSRQKRQLNFESDSTENDQRPTSKVFFGLTNIFGSGFGGIVGSNGNGDSCSCSTGSDPGDRVPAPRVGQLCNCATSVEFGGDCKGRDPGDRREIRK